MSEQARNDEGLPISSERCGACVWEQETRTWWWGRIGAGMSVVSPRSFRPFSCPRCEARLYSDGTSGPSAEEFAEWLRDEYTRAAIAAIEHQVEKRYQYALKTFGAKLAFAKIADYLDIDLEATDDE
ncbi:MAG: hypothetical protein ACLFWB_08400 [Armatimonadota bacterium]